MYVERNTCMIVCPHNGAERCALSKCFLGTLACRAQQPDPLVRPSKRKSYIAHTLRTPKRVSCPWLRFASKVRCCCSTQRARAHTPGPQAQEPNTRRKSLGSRRRALDSFEVPSRVSVAACSLCSSPRRRQESRGDSAGRLPSAPSAVTAEAPPYDGTSCWAR